MILHILFQSDDLALMDRVAETLTDALAQAGLGTITDIVGSLGIVGFTVEVSDPVRAIATIREALVGFDLPPGASIHQFSPERIVHPLHEPVA